MSKTVFQKRLALLKVELRKRLLDSFIVTKGVNVSYLSGFAGHDAACVITQGRAFLFADSRYIEEAGDSVKDFDIRLVKRSLYDNIKEIAGEHRLKRVGFESMDLPYEVAGQLRGFVKGSTLVPVRGLVEDLRAVKDSEEIGRIRRSIRLTKDVLGRAIPFIKPGATEESLARKIEIAFLINGARPSFAPIVAADANSSKPHAVPTARKVSKNSVVMIDIGCVLAGYHSDITRMITIGKIRPRMAKIYEIVRSAQAMAIEAISPGARIAGVDAAARLYIRRKGFGKYFGHALGNGVGMEVHESPSVSGTAEGTLKPGMIFTVEPAIYIPKFGGIRVEDMVLVTDKGCEILTK
jgi:Xaa-Pro aminopeptidase